MYLTEKSLRGSVRGVSVKWPEAAMPKKGIKPNCPPTPSTFDLSLGVFRHVQIQFPYFYVYYLNCGIENCKKKMQRTYLFHSGMEGDI